MTELENLQAIVADEGRSAEERKAAAEHILALGQKPTKLTPSRAIAPTEANMSQPDAKSLAEMKTMLKEILDDDPAPYLDAQKRCAVCLRHQLKQVTKCELCGTEDQFEPVTNHHPTWTRLGRGYDATREHLSNLQTRTASLFEIAHLRWLLTWREGDGTKQVNAAKFVPTPHVLSHDQRKWVKQLLEWVEPGQAVAEPELDAPEPHAEADVTVAPEREIAPGDLNKLFDYQTWKIEREAAGQPSAINNWIASAK
jgi:hypothetical protein